MRIFQYSKLAKLSQFRVQLSNKVHSRGTVCCSLDRLDSLRPLSSHPWVLFYRPLKMYELWNPSFEIWVPSNPRGDLDAVFIFSYRLEPQLPLLWCCWRSGTVRAFISVLGSHAGILRSPSRSHLTYTGILQKLWVEIKKCPAGP